jgi:signal transduction histidine kinase
MMTTIGASSHPDGMTANPHGVPDKQIAPCLLLRVSPAHRHLAIRQFTVQQVATWITVIGLVVANASEPFLPPGMIWTWALTFLASWLLRMLMITQLYKLPPSKVARSRFLSSLPLLSGVIGCVFWVWTVDLFTGPTMTIRELILCIGFLSISITMTGMWPVTPLTSLIYYVVLWTALSWGLWRHGTATLPTLLMFNVIVAVILWLTVLQARSQIARASELDRALRKQIETSEQLDALRQSATATLETRSEFFAEASHDFRQRLHATKLWVASVMHEAEHVKMDRWPINRLSQEIDSLQAYVNDVLEFARIESIDAGVQLAPTDIQSLFQTLALDFENVSEHDGIDLRIRRARAVVDTDASMLLRVLENLVSNALKYTTNGVLVCARRSGAFLSLEVWDQGPGIKREAHQRIFDAFHREDEEGEPLKRKGVGLGLAIVRRFVDRLGYTVEVRSILGKGTLFRVRIPAARINEPFASERTRRGGTS